MACGLGLGGYDKQQKQREKNRKTKAEKISICLPVYYISSLEGALFRRVSVISHQQLCGNVSARQSIKCGTARDWCGVGESAALGGDATGGLQGSTQDVWGRWCGFVH